MNQFLHEINGEKWLIEDEKGNMKISYRIKEVIAEKQSDFQHVMIVDTYEFGRMLVLDGVVQTTSLDGHIYNEMITHIPLNVHPNPERVLIIGGGDCGAAREAMKYDKVKQLDMAEIDEWVVHLSKEHLPAVSGNLSDPRVNFIFTDGIKHIETCNDKYDVIIVDSSDPVGPAEQLFSKDFYQKIHRALKEDGLMVCQSQSPLMHREVMSRTYHTLGQLFPHRKLYIATVPTYPGGFWSFTLASKKYHEVDATSFDKETKYVNQQILKNCFELPEFLKEYS